MIETSMESLTRIAQILDDAANHSKPVQQVSTEAQFDLGQAYQIQALSIDRRIRRGEQICGYKLGFTSKAKMEQMGVHELIWGRLTDAMEINNEKLDITNFIHPRAEPEIAFRLSKDLDRSIMDSEWREYVDAICVAIEIIDSRYENFKFSLEDVVADNCSSSAFKLGEWKSPDVELGNLSMRMEINNVLVQSGNSSAILGHPVNALLEASRIFEREGIKVKKGEFLLAGAATPAVHIHKGNAVKVHCEFLNNVGFNVI